MKFADLNQSLRSQLSKYGLNAELWDNVVLRTTTIEREGAHFLDLNNFGSLVKQLHPEKPFREAADVLEAGERIEANPTTRQSGKAGMRVRLREQSLEAGVIYDKIQIVRDVENKLREFVATESEFAMMSGADARVRAISTLGHQRGTLIGEAMRTVSLYKSFPASIILSLVQGITCADSGRENRLLERLRCSEHGDRCAFFRAKEIVKGRDPARMDTPEFWLSALQQGGALSVFEGLLEAENGFERVARQLAGPVPAMLESAFNLTLGNLSQFAQGKDTNAGREAARFLEQHTPGSNLWYTRLIVQRYWFDNLRRLLDHDPRAGFSVSRMQRGDGIEARVGGALVS